MTNKPSLQELERHLAARRIPEALQMALDILRAIDNNYGGLQGIAVGTPYPGSSEEDAAVIFATRFAAALGNLITDHNLKISPQTYERLSAQHRWIDLIFSLSGFRNSDNFISLIAKDAGDRRVSFEGTNLLRMLLLRCMNSFVDVDFEKFWRAHRVSVAIAFLNYIGSRCVFSRRAFEFREQLLEWIPSRLNEVKLGSITLSHLPSVYMNCSYALTAKKHAVKRPLIEQVRRACLEAGVVETSYPIPPRHAGQASIVVVGERFSLASSSFRCFASAVRSLRERFKVLGVIDPDPGGTLIAGFFDESIAIPREGLIPSVRTMAAEIAGRKPALIWYLGVGILPQVIALASLRLAPVQCASIGHNASTMSPAIDYFLLPEDWVASPACFSEKVVALPKAAMPFSPRLPPYVRRQPADGTIRVAIAGSIAKLNPVLFDTIARIAVGANSDCEFHFFTGAGTDLPHAELSRIVRGIIPRAVFHRQMPFEQYMEKLAQCDFFLSPFPHGGMTTIMDTFQLGLPGVCLDGAEPHAHADAAIFARIGLPTDLVAKSLDGYVAAAIKLIDDEAWRKQCGAIVRDADLDAAFFNGDPSLFAAAVENLIWPQST